MQTHERTPTSPATPPRPSRRRRLVPALAAGLVAVIAIVVAVAILGGADDAPLPPVGNTTIPAPTTAPEPEVDPAEVDPAEAEPTPITTRFGSLARGTHLVDTLGSPFTFTVDQSNLFVQENTNTLLVLAAPNSQGPDDRDMVFIRLSALPDPAAPYGSPNGWPVDDFGGWLDNLTDSVLTSDREETTLDGLNATRVELELGDLECCIRFGSSKSLISGSKYRILVVEQEGDDPLAVILGITNESDRDWVDAYEKILLTLAFGEG